MKKLCLVLLSALLCLLQGARAESVTLKTVSTFAGTEAAADTYAELLKRWQDETGNTVNDLSATSDETWKMAILNDFAAGNEADVLFFFSKTGDSAAILNKVVPIEEINAAYPELHLSVDERMTERDGRVYAIPVRSIWEGLFCNVDLFVRYGLELPTTWDKMEMAIETFRKEGIVPISVSLSDVPHYLVEFSILSSGSPADHARRPQKGEAVPESWNEGMRMIRRLYQLGAFDQNVNATTEAAQSQMFRDKKAAMQVDGSWFANSIGAEGMKTTVIIPFPAYNKEADPTAYINCLSMGFYLTRAAWMDDARRDAAVDLLNYLTTGENAIALGVYNISDELLNSYNTMVSEARCKNPPIQDDMRPEARGRLLSSIPGIADGTINPEEMWVEIMEMDPFNAD